MNEENKDLGRSCLTRRVIVEKTIKFKVDEEAMEHFRTRLFAALRIPYRYFVQNPNIPEQ